MPTIVFATSKGGAGKTTATIVLASELARQGASKKITVSLIDADPNQHTAHWAKKEGCPNNIHLIENANEKNILDYMEDAEAKSQFIIVDLEGTASIAVANAVSRADLVVVLCQGSQDDADEAVKTIKLIKNQGRLLKKEIPFSVLMSRTSGAITPKTLTYILEQFAEAGIDVFKSSLVDREAFRAIRSFGGTVNDLDPSDVSGIQKAAENARIFTEEVKLKLKSSFSLPRKETPKKRNTVKTKG